MPSTMKARAREQTAIEAPTSPWPNEMMAAQSLARFVEDARETLDRLDRARARREREHPGERDESEILRFLARSGDWVDFLDLPDAGASGRNERRRRVRRMAEEGILEIDASTTYPNMIALRITPVGREELRRRSVKEAMGVLIGTRGDVYRVVAEAHKAIRELDALIGERRDGR